MTALARFGILCVVGGFALGFSVRCLRDAVRHFVGHR